MQHDSDFPMTVGTVLGKSIAIFFRNLPAFLLMAAIVYSPLFVWAFVSKSPYELGSLQELNDWVFYATLALLGGGMLLGMIMSAPVIYAVVEELNGRHAPIGRSLSVGLGRMLPVLGVGILFVIVAALGFIALIVPGLIIVCVLYVVIPATVIEKPGIGGAFSRSAFLTKGFRWQIFGMVILLVIINKAVGYIVENMFKNEIGIVGPDDWRLFLVLAVAAQAVVGALASTVNATTYVALRREKDGVGVGELARVFE